MKPEIALRNALLEIISCMLSPNSEDRRIAEERKKALEVTDEYALHLLEIVLTAEEALEERQMAAILLEQYVRNHWSELEDEFVPPQASEFVKGKIKSILPMGLSDLSGKVRNHIAYILANIASYDYPDDWSTMDQSVFSRIDLDGTSNCLGIIAFINEFSRLATHNQINSSAEQIYAILFTISKENTKYSTKMRTEAVWSLCSFLYAHASDAKEKQKLVNSGTVTKFCELLALQLILPHPEQSDYELKSQILMFYSMLLIQMPDAVVPSIINILPNIWQILSRCGQVYDQVLANEIPPYRDPTENLEDSPRFYILAFHVFDVLHTLISTHQAAFAVTGVLPDLVYYLILFMGIPKEVELLWKSDPDIYINDDLSNDCCLDSSVRVLAKELLMLITTELETPQILNALTIAVDKHILLCKGKSESYYWRVMEAVMYAVGSIRNFIVNVYKKKQHNGFEIVDYLTQWAEEIGPCPSWLMLARIMWVGGRYALLLHANNISTYLMTTIHNLRESSFILRYSAMRALSLHLATMTQSEFQAMYMEIRDPIAHALIYALEHSQGQIIHIGLRALENVLKPQPPIIESVQNEVITLMLHLFLRNLANPEIVNDLHAIVKQLCKNNNCRKNLEARFLPVISNVIDNPVRPDNSKPCTFEGHSCAIELLSTMVRYSRTPLSDEIIRCFFSVCRCMVAIEDSIITQCGADCLRTYLCKVPSQIVPYTDSEGFTGADYILNILRHFLDPQKMEFYCRQVGRLCITAIHTLGTNLDLQIGFLLKDMLSSMQRTNDISVEESLLVIFACLFYTHLDTVIYYLTLIPGPQGESALTFVLNRWLSKRYNFGGRYQCNLNILALAKLIEHTILKQDQRVADIKLRGDPIPRAYFQSHDATHTKYVTAHFTEVPVLLKIVKFLLRVLQKELQIHEVESEAISTLESESEVRGAVGQSTVEPRTVESKKREQSGQNSPVPEVGEIFETEELSDGSDSDSHWGDSDTDFLDSTNPIYNMKLSEFLSNFLKNLAESGYFSKCMPLLDESEKKSLIEIGVNMGM